MDFTQAFIQIWQTTGIYSMVWQQGVMIAICCFLLWLGIKKQFEPLLLIPIAFGGLLANIPMPAGFARIAVTTAEKHDRLIAFTSQLAHVVSNAYIKSPTASEHAGFSAGSYRDLTRVAWLNPTMWSDLFMENSDNLLFEIDQIIGELRKYRDAIAARDEKTLWELLEAGRVRKEEVDG